MAVVPLQTDQLILRPNPVVSLEEYAKFVGYDECAFFGVDNEADTNYECRDIWSLDQRNFVLHYLSEAQKEIEDQIGYFLTADWIVGTIADERDSLDRYVDQKQWSNLFTNPYNRRSFKTRWAKIITPGIRAEADISLGEVVDYTSDPAVIGPIATAVTDINEIHVFYPGEDLEINPSSITLSGGNLTIEIPRCRLVNFDRLNNPASGWDYTDLANFTTTVDIKRIYTDNSTQANLICENCADCATRTLSGCLRVVNEQMGTLRMDVNNLSCSCGCLPQRVGLYYYCGQLNATKNEKDVVIRLAHSKMPEQPCGCDFAQRLWDRDQKIPDVLTRERANNPFGLNDGAWVAWQWTQQLKITKFGMV